MLKDVDIYSELSGKELQQRLFGYMAEQEIKVKDMGEVLFLLSR